MSDTVPPHTQQKLSKLSSTSFFLVGQSLNLFSRGFPMVSIRLTGFLLSYRLLYRFPAVSQSFLQFFYTGSCVFHLLWRAVVSNPSSWSCCCFVCFYLFPCGFSWFSKRCSWLISTPIKPRSRGNVPAATVASVQGLCLNPPEPGASVTNLESGLPWGIVFGTPSRKIQARQFDFGGYNIIMNGLHIKGFTGTATPRIQDSIPHCAS